MVELKGGARRTCGCALESVDADDATITVECIVPDHNAIDPSLDWVGCFGLGPHHLKTIQTCF